MLAAPQAEAQTPAVPGLTVTPVAGTTDKLDVSWNAVGGADLYALNWKLSGSPSYSELPAGITPPDTSYRISGLTGGTTYTILVQARNSAGTTIARSETTATTNATTTTKPAVRNLSVTAVSGSLSLVHGDTRQSTDIALKVVAAGGRAELLRPEGEGFSLALKSDAFFVRTESAGVSTPGVGNLASARGDASRVRAVLEGSRTFALSGGGSVEPSLTLGLRHDGGDAESGAGVELGAGLAWSDPSRGLTSDLRLYGLAAHEEDSYDEWGASGSLRIAPAARSGRGLSLSMTPSWGARGESGRLWDTQTRRLRKMRRNVLRNIGGRKRNPVEFGDRFGRSALSYPQAGGDR